MGYSLKQFKKILKEVGANEFIEFLPPVDLVGSNASALKDLATYIESDPDVLPNSLLDAIADLSYKTTSPFGKV